MRLTLIFVRDRHSETSELVIVNAKDVTSEPIFYSPTIALFKIQYRAIFYLEHYALTNALIGMIIIFLTQTVGISMSL